MDTKDTVKLSELIYWVKKELADETYKNDVPLFLIDEVTLEINFVVSGEVKGGLDLQVVKVGAQVAEERVQKAIVHMKSLVTFEEIRERVGDKRLTHLKDRMTKMLVKGLDLTDQDVPTLE